MDKKKENCDYHFSGLCTYDLDHDEQCNGVCNKYLDIYNIHDLPEGLFEEKP